MFIIFTCFVYCSTAVLSAPIEGGGESIALHDGQSGCVWDCKVVNLSFAEAMKTLNKHTIVSLDFKYEQLVDDKCLNQTYLSHSFNKLAEIWIWLTRNNKDHGGQNISTRSRSNSDLVTVFRKSFEGEMKVDVLCSLRPATEDFNNTQLSLNDLITIALLEEVSGSIQEPGYSETVLRYKLLAENGSFVCVNRTTKTVGENTGWDWQQQMFTSLVLLIGFVSLGYFPVLFCHFKPTEIKTETGSVNIALRVGTNPLGICSCIGNLLSSYTDSIKWKLAQIFLLTSFSTVLWIFVDKLEELVFPTSPRLGLKLINPRLSTQYYYIVVINSLCSCLLAIVHLPYFYCPCRQVTTKPCPICDKFGDKTGIVHYDLCEEIEIHLRIQPFIILRCFKVTFYSFKRSLPCRKQRCTCLRYLVYLVLLPLIVGVYLVVCLGKVAAFLLLSSPWAAYVRMVDHKFIITRNRLNRCTRVVMYFLSAVISLPFLTFVVVQMAYALLLAIRGILMNFSHSLPYTSLTAVTIYYIWMCFRAFTRTYAKLAAKLYRDFKARAHGEENEPINRTEEKTRVIPKRLFEAARNELMPLRASVPLLVLRLIAILIGVLILLTVMETPGVSDNAQAILALITLLIPKIYDIMFGTDPEIEKLDEESLDERVKAVVEEYFGNGRNGIQNAINNNIVNESSIHIRDTFEENEGLLQGLGSEESTVFLYDYGTSTAPPSSLTATTENGVTS